MPLDHPELPTQPQMTSSQWEWAQGLIHDVEEQRKFDSLLYIWPFVTRQFQKLEINQMRAQVPSPVDLKFHRQCVTELIAIGTWLELQAQKDPKQLPDQVQLLDIQSIVRSLQHSYDEFHALEPSQGVAELSSRIFGQA